MSMKNKNTAMEPKWEYNEAAKRIDSFSFNNFQFYIDNLIKNGQKWIAIDFTDTQFLSLVGIKYISQTTDQLRKMGGELALISVSEKLKKQISIYSELDKLFIIDKVSVTEIKTEDSL